MDFYVQGQDQPLVAENLLDLKQPAFIKTVNESSFWLDVTDYSLESIQVLAKVRGGLDWVIE